MDNIKDSKCSTCKFGICVKEMVIESDAGPPTEHEAWEADQAETPVWVGSHVTSFCYWHPTGTTNKPIGHHVVTDCSRYAKE